MMSVISELIQIKSKLYGVFLETSYKMETKYTPGYETHHNLKSIKILWRCSKTTKLIEHDVKS